MPAFLNVNRKVPPTATLPLSNVCPSSLVTVCGTDDTFFHITVVPALIVSVEGLKPKLPLLSFTIISICVKPETGVDVVGAKEGVGVGAVAPIPGVALPHDVSNSMPNTTKIRTRQVRRHCKV